MIIECTEVGYYRCIRDCVGAEIVPGTPGSGPVFLEKLSCTINDKRILDCDRLAILFQFCHLSILLMCVQIYPIGTCKLPPF